MRELLDDERMSREGYDQLYPELEQLARTAEHLLAKGSARLPEAEQMARDISRIRNLLSELFRLSRNGDGKVMPPEIARYLAERFLSLEGKAKELRNDLIRA